MKFSKEDVRIFQSNINDVLDLSNRARKSLENNNICTMAQLLSMHRKELLRMQNFGKTSLDEVQEKLAPLNMSLEMLTRFYDVIDDPSTNLFDVFDEAGLMDARSIKSSPVADFFKEALPEKIRNGLKEEFLDAVLESPEVKEKIRQVVANVLSAKLGLDRN